MNRHFRPEPYREAYRRHEEKQVLREPPPPQPPYTIYWWRRTQLHEKTRQFWISFKVVPNRDQVYDALSKVFAGVHVYANGPWFIVDLDQNYTWEEVRGVVALALKEMEVFSS